MHPEIDRFAHLASPMHRWDPRWKLGTLLPLMMSLGIGGSRVSDLGGLAPHAAGLAVAAALVLLSRIPPGFVLRRLRPVAAFLLVLAVVLPLSYPGEKVRVGFLSVSAAGGLAAGAMVLRALAIILLVFPAFGTTRFDGTMKALRALRVPAPMVQLVLFTYRYLFVYADQLRRMGLALRARGFRPRTDRATLRVLGNGVGVLLVGSIERTQRIHDAMRCRGFAGDFRTLDEFSTRASDVLLSAAALGAGAALLAWRLS